jgi:hypothetical protein
LYLAKNEWMNASNITVTIEHQTMNNYLVFAQNTGANRFNNISSMNIIVTDHDKFVKAFSQRIIIRQHQSTR